MLDLDKSIFSDNYFDIIWRQPLFSLWIKDCTEDLTKVADKTLFIYDSYQEGFILWWFFVITINFDQEFILIAGTLALLLSIHLSSRIFNQWARRFLLPSAPSSQGRHSTLSTTPHSKCVLTLVLESRLWQKITNHRDVLTLTIWDMKKFFLKIS